MARFVLRLATLTVAFSGISLADEADMARGISDEDLARLGERWADAMTAGDATELSGMVDFEALAIRSAETFVDNEGERAAFVAGFTNGGSRMVQTWINDVESADGFVKFLRVREFDGMRGPLVRYDLADRGYNYGLLIVESGADTRPMVVDMFVAMSGERLSDSFGAISRLVFAPDDSLLGKLFGLTEPDPELLATIQEFSQLRVAGRNTEAYAKLGELPESVRNHRTILNIATSLAVAISPEAYRKELERLAMHHGDDPTAGFALADYYFYEGDYATAIRMVEGMERTFGADAALASLKSNIALVAGDLPVAEKHARLSIELEPDHEDGYWSLLSSLVQSGQYGEAVDVLDDLEQNFDYLFEESNFDGEESFKGLTRSPEFSAWIDGRATNDGRVAK